MQLYLTHADTPYRMYKEELSLSAPALQLRLSDLDGFESATVVFAFWSDWRLSDEAAWEAYLAMRADCARKCAALPANIKLLYAMEDARPLAGDTAARLDILMRDGVKILTPLWRGESRLGGAFDTSLPLTPLGVRVAEAAAERGMTLDISHASRESAAEIMNIAQAYGTPVCATHSNFYTVHPHPRNLTDAEACRIAQRGGVIGLSFVPSHLGGRANLDSLFRHIEHGLSLGLAKHLALGTDYDGTDELPRGLDGGSSDLYPLAFAMRARGYDETFIEDFFCGNAARALPPGEFPKSR